MEFEKFLFFISEKSPEQKALLSEEVPAPTRLALYRTGRQAHRSIWREIKFKYLHLVGEPSLVWWVALNWALPLKRRYFSFGQVWTSAEFHAKFLAPVLLFLDLSCMYLHIN